MVRRGESLGWYWYHTARSRLYSFMLPFPWWGKSGHSLGAGTVNRATAASGVKVAIAPAGLDLDASARRGRTVAEGETCGILRLWSQKY
jgi:hypothetical protein